MRGKFTVYLDQCGRTHTARTVRELRSKIPGRMSKMYIDKADGTYRHVGYVIGRLWLSAYVPYECKA